MTKKSKQNFKYLEKEKSWKKIGKIKSILKAILKCNLPVFLDITKLPISREKKLVSAELKGMSHELYILGVL